MAPIKLISLNIALFEANNHKVESFLQKEKPDIVCLQEVTRIVDESAHGDFISIDTINRATRALPYSFYAPNWIMKDFNMKDFHGYENFNMDFKGFLELGNYCKSRFPIYKGQCVFLQNHYTYATDWTSWGEHESRSVQINDLIADNGKKLRVINYHGIWSRNKMGNEKTKAACEKICELAQQVTYPVIICGDFNLFPDTPSIEVLNKQFVSLVDTYNVASTRPATNELNSSKRNVVDYIFIKGKITPVDFKVIENDVSDHLPLVLDFLLE